MGEWNFICGEIMLDLVEAVNTVVKKMAKSD